MVTKLSPFACGLTGLKYKIYATSRGKCPNQLASHHLSRSLSLPLPLLLMRRRKKTENQNKSEPKTIMQIEQKKH